MRINPNWRETLRHNSTRALAAIAVLPVVWMELPPDIKDMLPPEWRPWIFIGLGAAGIVGKVTLQRPKE